MHVDDAKTLMYGASAPEETSVPAADGSVDRIIVDVPFYQRFTAVNCLFVSKIAGRIHGWIDL